MGLRERLDAKSRRRVVVPVLVGEPTQDDVRRVAEAQAAYLEALAEGDTPPASAVDEAMASFRVDVEFQALPPNEFEAIAAGYPAAEGDDGGMDWKSALPVLAAMCAVDEDLRDEAWWAKALSDEGSWSHGERHTLWRALLHINANAPDPRVPKG